MTERLADVSTRIEGVRELGSIVTAMRGIAAARAQQARGQLVAVDAYAETIARGIGRALALAPALAPDDQPSGTRPALVLFCAEQGFAGVFSERVLDLVDVELASSELYLVGDRGATLAAERGIAPYWRSPMPSHSFGVPKFADRIAEALYARIATGKIDRLDAIFNQWRPGEGVHVERRRLFPLDLTVFQCADSADPPVAYLKPEALLTELTFAYTHAQLCNLALHAFAAENQARMEAMTRANSQIERNLAALLSTQRVVRQEEITSEIVELAAGVSASMNPARATFGFG
jgi:F-type H+-transporting ATPase subunit gamma